MPCQVWVGKPLDEAHSAPLVAMESPAGWVVVPQSEAGSQPAHEIRRLVARPSVEQSRRVAVLDQDREAGDRLTEQLKAAGLQTQAFYSAESLVAADSAQPFDGYVLDWLLGGAAGRALIRMIRGRDAQCPVVVFSGELGSKLVDERDVAEALTTYGLLFHEKPMRAMIVAADLARAFAALQ